jgi:hypothetical protein
MNLVRCDAVAAVASMRDDRATVQSNVTNRAV